MNQNFHITKTFEPKQKSERSWLDLLVIHPSFWWSIPTEYTKQEYVAGMLRSGGTIKLQIPGYADFYIKPVEFWNERNGSWILCGILANTRQWTGVASAHLVDPDEIAGWKLRLLRNSDRYVIRELEVHYSEHTKLDPKKKNGGFRIQLDKELRGLSVLDKKIF